jgi:zinc-ribbon family
MGDDMFIFYSFRNRDVVVTAGAFDCPNCKRRKYCKHRKIESWLSVFGIPLFPWELLAEYCQCDDCRRSFEAETLQPFLPAGGYLRTDVRAELESGAPIEPVIERLMNSGIDAMTVFGVINEVGGDSRNLCTQCGLSYLTSVATCRNCGRATVKASEKKGGWLDELA